MQGALRRKTRGEHGHLGILGLLHVLPTLLVVSHSSRCWRVYYDQDIIKMRGSKYVSRVVLVPVVAPVRLILMQSKRYGTCR